MAKKYKVEGSIRIYLDAEFEDDGWLDLADQAHEALEEEAIDKLGILCIERGELELDGYEEAK